MDIKPSQKHLEETLKCWNDKNSHYTKHETALKTLLNKTPNNTKFDEVLIKVAVLDNFYSTNLRRSGLENFSKIAEFITKINFDERVKSGELSLVKEIATATKSGESGKRCYSFATKYCVLHNENDFVIFDNVVSDLLYKLNKRDKFAAFTKSEIKSYEHYDKYKNTLSKFKEHYKLNCTWRELDGYLWTIGK